MEIYEVEIDENTSNTMEVYATVPKGPGLSIFNSEDSDDNFNQNLSKSGERFLNSFAIEFVNDPHI